MGRFRPEKVIRPARLSLLVAAYGSVLVAAPEEAPTIKVNVRLVRMLVTVKDASGPTGRFTQTIEISRFTTME